MRNRAQCRQCKDVIESKHRHDYVTCKCGAISLDGGKDYWRAAVKEGGTFDDIIRLPEEHEFESGWFLRQLKSVEDND